MGKNARTSHDNTLAEAIIQAMWIKGLITQDEKNIMREHCKNVLKSSN